MPFLPSRAQLFRRHAAAAAPFARNPRAARPERGTRSAIAVGEPRQEAAMSLERFTRHPVASLEVDRPSIEAAELMARRHIGAVVIVQDRRPVGIITDRDLALRLFATGLTGATPIREVMTRNLVCLRANETLDQAIFTFRKSGVRRLPIVDGEGMLVGIVALDDLMVLLSAEMSSLIEAVLDNRGP
jgi:CBS domain-containing protein